MGGPKTAQPGTSPFGAIIEGPEGAVILRCTGPTEMVNAGEKAFRGLMESTA